MKRFSKRTLVVASTIAAAATAGGVAFAYFTTTGSGTGTGTVGTSQALTIHQASITYSNSTAENALLPGTTAAVTFTVDNPSSGHEFLNHITLFSVASDKAGCDSTSQPTWFTMSAFAPATDYGPGNGQAVAGSATITFNNTATIQDACKGASLTFTYHSD